MNAVGNVKLKAAEKRLQAMGMRPAPERCEHCDDTGDVIGFDGEWRGYCTCDAGRALKAWSKPPCQQCGAKTADEAAQKCLGAAAGDDCHGNHLWPT